MTALVVNLFAGPGTGKSTIAAGVFSELKWHGVNCELVTEYAKDKVWEGSTNVLSNQVLLLGKQYHRLWRLQDQVDVIVTDSPLLLLGFYGRKMGPEFHAFVKSLHDGINNYNIFLRRFKYFNPKGRLQNEQEARDIDLFLYNETLSQLEFDVFDALPASVSDIAYKVLGKMSDLNDGG